MERNREIQTDGKTQRSDRERKIINFQLAKIEFWKTTNRLQIEIKT
jgi:hypothetical protein